MTFLHDMTVYEQISKNKRKTVILITVFVLLVVTVGYFIGVLEGPTGRPEDGIIGLAYATIIAIVMTLGSYFGGDKLALVTSGAKPVTKKEAPEIVRIVENVAITAGIPMPTVYMINDPIMNAFATGRNPEHGSIALTTGLVAHLENEELEAVIAHELSHIRNYDSRVMMIVVVLVGIIALISNWMFRVSLFGGGRRNRDNSERNGQIGAILAVVGLIFIILSPIIAELIKLAISRKREYLADASAVLLTRYADGLIRALEKIGGQSGTMQHANTATAHLFFVSPFGPGKTMSRLFSTHPPLEDRIRALRGMGL